MVLEVLGAFALACNVLQVVEYGIRVTTKAIEYGRSDTGSIAEFHALGEITNDLSSMSLDLEQRTTYQRGIGCATSIEANLLKANENCLRVTKEFQKVLARFDLGKCRGVSRRLMMATRVVWSRKEVQDMEKALTSARSNLHFAFVLYSHSNIENLLHQTKDEVEEKILKAIQRKVQKVTNEPNGETLSTALSKLDLGGLAIDADVMSSAQHTHATTLNELSLNLNRVASSHNATRKIVYDSETLAVRNAILETLYFEGIRDRYDHIKAAHRSTFEWALHEANADGNSEIVRWLECPQDGGLARTLWISGKPGSGKSTLVRHIAEHLFNTTHTNPPLDESDVCFASFYFWKPGKPLQRSLEGFLRALLFQLLEHDSQLIDTVTPRRCWDAASASIGQTRIQDRMQWSTTQLRDGLLGAISGFRRSAQIVLLLDGLDELDGGDESRHELLRLLAKISEFSYVKTCISSRPWTIFQDWFSDIPQVLLERHTQKDIQTYVRDNLQQDKNFKRSCGNKEAEMEELTLDIVSKAQGVFLWVYLVVRELLKGARDGERLRTLKERFNRIPPDLDQYFQQIMESIEIGYRREASMLLQIQLQYVTSSVVRGVARIQPRLFDLSFIDRATSHFALQTDFSSDTNFDDHEERALLTDLMKRRISSRCMGLLEVKDVQGDKRTAFLGSPVEIFHRTFADFLLLPASQRVLHNYTEAPFDVSLYRINAYLAILMSSKQWPRDLILLLLSCVLSEIGAICCHSVHIPLTNPGTDEDVAPQGLNYHTSTVSIGSEAVKIIDALVATVTRFLDKWTYDPAYNDDRKDKLGRLLNVWQTSQGSYIREIAVTHGWVSWINENMTPTIVSSKPGRPFLHHALFPNTFMEGCSPNFECNWGRVVPILLRLGADPNCTHSGSTIWKQFLGFIPCQFPSMRSCSHPLITEPCLYKTIELMIAHGADLAITGKQLAEIDDFSASPNSTDKRVKEIWPLLESSKKLASTKKPVYSVISLLSLIGLPAQQIAKIEAIVAERRCRLGKRQLEAAKLMDSDEELDGPPNKMIKS